MKNLFLISLWPYWVGFSFERLNKSTDEYYCWEWTLYLGFWELHKWRKDKYGALRNYVSMGRLF